MRSRLDPAVLLAAILSALSLYGCSQGSSPAGGVGGKTGTGGTSDRGGSATGGTAGHTTSTTPLGNGGNGGAAPGSGGSAQGSAGAAATGGVVGGASGGTMSGSGGGVGGAMSSGGSTPIRTGTGGAATGGVAGAGDAGLADGSRDVGKNDTSLGDVADDFRAAGGAGDGPGDGAGGTGSGDTGGDANKQIKVWLAGDSTVMSCSDSCPCGWGSQFQSLLNANATVVNSAVGGRSIQTWLYDPNVTTTMDANGECVVNPKTYSSRWQEMIDPSTGMKPGDYLFIEFGINDGDTTCNRHVGTALFQTYLGTMAQAAKKLGAQPVFLTSTSYIGCSGSTATTNRGFVSETKAAGSANGVPVIDLTALSAALYTSLGLCPNNADYTSTTSAVGKFFCDDHTHFEAAGAVQIAKVVAKAIKDQGIGLAAYLR